MHSYSPSGSAPDFYGAKCRGGQQKCHSPCTTFSKKKERKGGRLWSWGWGILLSEYRRLGWLRAETQRTRAPLLSLHLCHAFVRSGLFSLWELTIWSHRDTLLTSTPREESEDPVLKMVPGVTQRLLVQKQQPERTSNPQDIRVMGREGKCPLVLKHLMLRKHIPSAKKLDTSTDNPFKCCNITSQWSTCLAPFPSLRGATPAPEAVRGNLHGESPRRWSRTMDFRRATHASCTRLLPRNVLKYYRWRCSKSTSGLDWKIPHPPRTALLVLYTT